MCVGEHIDEEHGVALIAVAVLIGRGGGEERIVELLELADVLCRHHCRREDGGEREKNLFHRYVVFVCSNDIMYNAREKSRSVLQKYVNLSSSAILLRGIYVKSFDEVCITTKYFTPSRCAVLSLAAVRLPVCGVSYLRFSLMMSMMSKSSR